MQRKITTCSRTIVAVGLLVANTGYAFDMGNMMNPSRWMNGNNRDYYDDYDRGYGGPGYGYGGPGYGYGGPGYGYGAPAYGAPGYGYGAPGFGAAPAYGYGGAPAYGGAPGTGTTPAYGGAPGYGATSSGADSDTAEQIKRLQDRIRQLEEAARKPPAPGADWGSQPAWSAPATSEKSYGNPSGYQYR